MGHAFLHLQNAEDLHPALNAVEVQGAVSRALASGAKGPLTYLGAGASGIVFRSADGKREYKVARRENGVAWTVLEEEAAYLHALSRRKDLRRYAPKGVRFHPDTTVIERAAVQSGEYRGNCRRVENWEAVWDKMKMPGWGRPEAKDDSFVCATNNKWVLVDGGGAHRRGEELRKYLRKVLDGKIPHHDSFKDLAFYVRMDAGDSDSPVVKAEAAQLNAALLARAATPALSGLRPKTCRRC